MSGELACQIKYLLPDSNIPHHFRITAMWICDMQGHKGNGKQCNRYIRQFVHWHPDLETTKTIERKLTEWWSRLYKRKGSPWQDSVPPKSISALAPMISFQNQKWHLPRFLVIWWPLWTMQPTTRRAPQESVWFRATIGHKYAAIDPGHAVFSWQLVGNINGVSLNQSQHSLLLLWPHPLVNPYSSPLKKCVSRWHSLMPWRLEVALANRQDKVKGHHWSISLWHAPSCFYCVHHSTYDLLLDTTCSDLKMAKQPHTS